MLIECRYYDMAVKRAEEYECEIAEDYDKMTAEELQDQEKQRESEASDIIRKGKEEGKRYRKVLNAQKMAAFDRLLKAALELARLSDMNITALKKDDGTYGYIELSYGISWMDPSTPEICAKTMAALYKNADLICTSVNKDCVIQRFDFELADCILDSLYM